MNFSVHLKDGHLICLYVLCISLANCASPSESRPGLFLSLSSERTGIEFRNELFEDEKLNILTYEYMYNGAGVGIGDINNDGLEDVFFSANMSSNRLYLNQGDFSFDDVSEAAGISSDGEYWSTGVSMVDINGDGWLDIYVSVSGPYPSEQRRNKLFINQQDESFQEAAALYGLDDAGHSIQTVFFDYDLDGDLDAYVLTNTTGHPGPNVIRPKILDGSNPNTDRLYRNDGQVYTNVSEEAGILSEGYGLGVSIRDINLDGWPDIYVSNDYLSNDLLYVNQGNGTFKEEAAQVFDHSSYSAMGNDIVDLNGDGWQDILAVDMLPPDNFRRKMMFKGINYDRFRSELIKGYFPQYMRNSLQYHRGIDKNGLPVFSEIGQYAGIHSTDWSWSILGADFDLDGKRDLLITNGYPKDITNLDFVAYKMNALSSSSDQQRADKRLFEALEKIPGAYLPNYIYKNTGSFSFEDVSDEWGMKNNSYSTGAAFADLDNDGDLDLVINNTYEPASIYENLADKQRKNNHFIQLELIGPEQNRLAIGSKVEVFCDSTVYFHEHQLVRGFQSSVSPKIHIGLGETTQIDSLKISWPNGKLNIRYELEIDSLYRINFDEPKVSAANALPLKTLFSEVNPKGLVFKHRESHYADFKIQPLIPHKFSQSGPKVEIGDLDGNGLDDLVIGGAFRQATYLYFQQFDGSFNMDSIKFEEAFEEDLGLALLDVDLDNDLDLYVGSGGSEFKAGSAYYQDRLYINDGKGSFKLAKGHLPHFAISTSCVMPSDVDQDGDMDLLIGGGLIPNAYPKSPGSRLLVNEDGIFEDLTAEIGPELLSIGMLKDGVWGDLDGDGWEDLILVGEWMKPSVFKNIEGKLRLAATPGLPAGWWHSLDLADLDQDGDLDIVLGNHGTNSPYQVSDSTPISIYMYDFNIDGRTDPVMTYFLQGKEYPVHFKDDLNQQIYDLRKWFPSYSAYATKSWEELFPNINLSMTPQFHVESHESMILENLGNFEFQIHILPPEAQMAPIQNILIEDFDNDGRSDLLFAQNSFAPETHSGRIDAGKGLLLKGMDNFKFKAIPLMDSGISVKGDMKGLAKLIWKDENLIVFTRNNGTIVLYEY